MKNTYRIEKEDGIPHTVFFVKKPTKKELAACAEKEGLVLESPLDLSSTIWKVHKTAMKHIEDVKAEKAEKTKKVAKAAKPSMREFIEAAGGEYDVYEPSAEKPHPLLRPNSVPSPSAAKERRVNVSLTVEWFKELSARGAALGLLPGQYARMLLVQSLNDTITNNEE